MFSRIDKDAPEDAPAYRRRIERDRRPCRDQESVEETYAQRSSGNTEGRQISLVQHYRDSSADSLEEVEEAFPPGVSGYMRRKTIIREDVRRASSAGYDRYSDDDDYYARSPRLDYDEKKSRTRSNYRRKYCTNNMQLH